MRYFLFTFAIWLLALQASPLAADRTSFHVTPTPEDKAVQETIARIDRWTTYLEHKNPKYKLGAMGDLWGNCSGEMAWILHRAGKKKFVRTTSRKMWLLWPGKRVASWEDASFPDLIWFHTVGPYKHVGIVRHRQDYPRKLQFSHASSSKGFIRSELTPRKDKTTSGNYWGSKFAGTKILDLTIGRVSKNIGAKP